MLQEEPGTELWAWSWLPPSPQTEWPSAEEASLCSCQEGSWVMMYREMGVNEEPPCTLAPVVSVGREEHVQVAKLT